MAKKPKGKFAIPPKKATQRVAKGNLSPMQANKIKHQADAVLGKNDSKYHNC